MSYDQYLSDDVQREVEALFYDHPYIDTHINNLEEQLKELDEDAIGSIGAASFASINVKTNEIHDSTGAAAMRLVADNHVKESIQEQIKYYKHIKKSTERILSFLEKHFFVEKSLVELYYFKRLKPDEIGRRLDLSQHSVTNLRKRAIFRAAELLGMIR